MAANKVKAKIIPFHRGVVFIPPWWNKNYSVAEQNFLHGGTDWFLHAFCLILIEETLEDALWRER